MKKVLIVYKFLPHYRVDFYEHLKAKLLKSNVELQLIYGKSNKTDALKNDETEIAWAQYIPNRRFFIGKTEIVWQPCLNQLSDKDLIIVQPENKLLLNFYLMFARKFSKYKFAQWGHVYNMQDNPHSLRNKIKRPFLSKCDWWFAYTKSAKDLLIKENYPENKITVVQNAIDTLNLKKYYQGISDADVIECKQQLGISGDNTAIFCGGMYPDKDFDFILDACNKIRMEVPDFHVLFLGSGIEAAKIMKAAEIQDWIHYVGPKFGKDRVIYFKISSLQLMPRLVGLCILDSFALETPLVTTTHPFHGPEIDYLENGVNGIMTSDSITEYSSAVISVLKSKEYFKLIEGGKKSADLYTVENMAENFKNGILSCIGL